MDFHDEIEVERVPGRKNEILGVFTMTLGVLCIVSLLIPGSVGVIGSRIKDNMTFAVGKGAFLPPIFLIALGLLLIIDKKIHNVVLRLVGIVLFFLVFVVFVQIPIGTDITGINENGGGVVGAFFCSFLLAAFGQVGTYLLLISLTLISLILMMEAPLVFVVASIGGAIVKGLTTLFSLIYGTIKGFGAWLAGLVERVFFLFPGRDGEDNMDLENYEVAITISEEEPPFDIDIQEETPPKRRRKRKKEEYDSEPEEVAVSDEPLSSASPGGTCVEQLKLIDPTLDYTPPPLSLLNPPVMGRDNRDQGDQSRLLTETFNNFGIEVKVTDVTRGPVVTRYEVQPAPGVKVSRIVSLADDLALSLAAPDIRIEAPIPGKSVVGIEVPNKSSATVYAREVLDSPKFRNSRSPLLIGLGKDVAGEVIVADLKDMVHLLVAGATGSGKSVCMNMIISSLVVKSPPDMVKFIMIDPKVVELTIYNGIPHLLMPVVTDPRKAALSLSWVVKEMERRYKLFAEYKARSIEAYNRKVLSVVKDLDDEAEEAPKPEFLPYIVVIIDELADLMMVAPGDVEDAICRLAQKARAAGIHLVLATQRPSADVITGLIKANIPSRIAFSVSSAVDSRIILDSGGAERLLGKGDMLFHPMGASKMTRIQGAFITDKEVERLVEFLREQHDPTAEPEVILEEVVSSGETQRDELFEEAVELILENGQASASMLQRRFRIGYTRAARIIDVMEDEGIVGPHEGSKPRVILITEEEWREREGAGEP